MPYKDKEKERERNRKRRLTKNYKEYQRKYQYKWREKNKDKWKEIQRKSDSKPERKAYLKKWWKESPKAEIIKKRFKENHPNLQKEYEKEWREKNPDKVKAKQEKYQYTKKGILNQIKKVQNRRIKFKKISGVYYNVPNKKLIELVDERDKVCVYCGRKFSKDNKSRFYRSYDHLDPFKPHSKTNTVRCCISCNSSKGEKNVFEWVKSKGYKISKVIYELSK